MGGVIEDKRLRGYRKYLLRNYLEGMPRIQMILQVRDQLPAILRGFTTSEGRGSIDDLERYVIEELGKESYSRFSDYNIFFDFDSTGEFKVVDGLVNRRGTPSCFRWRRYHRRKAHLSLLRFYKIYLRKNGIR